MNRCTVKKSVLPTGLSGQWDGPGWNCAASFAIDTFIKERSSHRPATRVKTLHDGASVHILFNVNDRFVRSIRTRYLDDVWNDSCVEWFVQPKPGKGYFNFEVNCGGTLFASYVEDPSRINGTLKKCTPLSAELGEKIKIYHSLPSVVDPEISGPIDWIIELAVPLTVLEYFVGSIGALSGQKWRANFNKCADETSHPAWATWNPVTELNFHRPWEFGEMVFE
jgi:hypothetical protein